MLLVFFTLTVFMLVLMLQGVMVLLTLVFRLSELFKQTLDQRGLDNQGCTVLCNPAFD